MELPEVGGRYGLGGRPDWMPDPGVHQFVLDVIQLKGFVDANGTPLNPSNFPDYWIPIGITGTMDWIVICGWWVWYFTGFFESDEPYKWIFKYAGLYEFDPDQLLMFVDDPEANQFEERFASPGIMDRERAEALPFLVHDVYAQWGVEPPPQMIIEIVMYATFLWVLFDAGRAWLSTLDPIFYCIIDYGVAYYSRWDKELLDPTQVERLSRELCTCHDCGEKLWCVRNYYIGSRQGDHGSLEWVGFCNNCALDRVANGFPADMSDHMLRTPKCPHHANCDADGNEIDDGSGACMFTACPHTPLTKEQIWEQFYRTGDQRMAAYRQHVVESQGQSPRQLAGQTVDDVVSYFS